MNNELNKDWLNLSRIGVVYCSIHITERIRETLFPVLKTIYYLELTGSLSPGDFW